MLLLSSFELLLLLAALLFTTGFAAAIYFSSKETPTLAHSLILLSLFIGLLTVIGVGATHLNAEKIDYDVEPMNQACEPPSDDRTTADSNDTQLNSNSSDYPDKVLDYSELSSEAQEVFRSTLQANGEYTTQAHPDEFELRLDTDKQNYIQYELECYQLTAQSRGGFATAFAVWGLLVFGGGATVIFALAGLFSYGWYRRQNSGWDQSSSNSNTRHRNCPNCDMSLVMGVEECQRCGWSPTNDDIPEDSSSEQT